MTERRVRTLTEDDTADIRAVFGDELRRLDQSWTAHIALQAALAERVNNLRNDQDTLSANLNAHVQECSKLQKRVLMIGIAILVWIVAHSPEVAGAFLKIFAG